MVGFDDQNDLKLVRIIINHFSSGPMRRDGGKQRTCALGAKGGKQRMGEFGGEWVFEDV